MKIKHKDFQTHQNSGFTLVELIVVIAILAILAAVAIPAYNGYIEKANKAADDQLIAAINKAAATAVLEANGEDMVMLGNGALQTDVGAVAPEGGISVWENKDTNRTGALATAFAKYFADNDTAVLKWYKGAAFKNGAFVGYRSLLEKKLNGVSGVEEAYKDSSYSELGVEGLTGMVDSLAGALADYPALNRVTKTGAFGKTLEILGIDPATADKQTMANAAVFHVAHYTSQLDADDVWSHLSGQADDGKDLTTWLLTDTNLGLDQDDAIFLSTALRYASATAYAYSNSATAEEKAAIANQTPTGRQDADRIIDLATRGDGYLFYLGNEANSPGKKDSGATDFDAFYKVMQSITDSADSFIKYDGQNFFSDPELQAALKEMLGEK